MFTYIHTCLLTYTLVCTDKYILPCDIFIYAYLHTCIQRERDGGPLVHGLLHLSREIHAYNACSNTHMYTYTQTRIRRQTERERATHTHTHTRAYVRKEG